VINPEGNYPMHKIIPFIAATLATAAVGCQLDTTESAAALATQDCEPGQNYPNAVMPPLPMWPQVAAPPVASDTASYVVYPSFTVPNEFVAVLADWNTGTILWGARVAAKSVPALASTLSTRGQIDIVRRPPKPAPSPGTEARFPLEFARRAAHLSEFAALAN